MKFKKLPMLCAALLCACFLFVGCSGVSVLKDNPAKDAPVYGNGGLAVVKGDYLYFVNGYTPYSSLSVGDNDGNADYATLYRVKLNASGGVEVDVKYDGDGEVIFDPAQTIKNTNVIAKKVVGFESMGIYIFGDYIYYASPNNQRSGSLTLRSDLVDIYRSKLDRSVGPERLYTTKQPGASVSYTMMQIGNTVYLEVLDGERIVVGKAVNGNWKGTEAYVTNATGAALPEFTDYTKIGSGAPDSAALNFSKYIYYTRNLTEKLDGSPILTGNALCRLDITNGETKTIFRDPNTIAIKAVVGDGIFYERTVSGAQSICFNNMSAELLSASEQRIAARTFSDYIFINDITGKGVIGYDGTNIWRCMFNETGSILVAKTITNLIKIHNNYIYYLAEGSVARLHIASPDLTDEVLSASTGAMLDDISKVSFAGEYMYYLKQYTNAKGSSYYLNRVYTVKQGDGTFTSEFVGVMLKKNYLEETETE